MKKTFSNLIKVSGLILPSFALAQPAPAISDITFGPTSVIALANNILTWAVSLITILAVLIILYAGYLFMTSGGDATKQTAAKTTLWWGILGIIVMAVAFTAQIIIRNFLGV